MPETMHEEQQGSQRLSSDEQKKTFREITASLVMDFAELGLDTFIAIGAATAPQFTIPLIITNVLLKTPLTQIRALAGIAPTGATLAKWHAEYKPILQVVQDNPEKDHAQNLDNLIKINKQHTASLDYLLKQFEEKTEPKLHDFFSGQKQQFEHVGRFLHGLREDLGSIASKTAENSQKISKLSEQLDAQKEFWQNFIDEARTDKRIAEEYESYVTRINGYAQNRYGMFFKNTEIQQAMQGLLQAYRNREPTQEIDKKKLEIEGLIDKTRELQVGLDDAHMFFEGVQLVGMVAELMGVNDSTAQKIQTVAHAGINICMAIAATNHITAAIMIVSAALNLKSAFDADDAENPFQQLFEATQQLFKHYSEAIVRAVGQHIDHRFDRIEDMLRTYGAQSHLQFYITNFNLQRYTEIIVKFMSQVGHALIRSQSDYFARVLHNQAEMHDDISRLIAIVVKHAQESAAAARKNTHNEWVDIIGLRDTDRSLLVSGDHSYKEILAKQKNYFNKLTTWLLQKIKGQHLTGRRYLTDEKHLAERYELTQLLQDNDLGDYLNRLLFYLQDLASARNIPLTITPEQPYRYFHELGVWQLLEFMYHPQTMVDTTYQPAIQHILTETQSLQTSLIRLRQTPALVEALFENYANAVDALIDHVNGSRFMPIYPPEKALSITPDKVEELMGRFFFEGNEFSYFAMMAYHLCTQLQQTQELYDLAEKIQTELVSCGSQLVDKEKKIPSFITIWESNVLELTHFNISSQHEYPATVQFCADLAKIHAQLKNARAAGQALQKEMRSMAERCQQGKNDSCPQFYCEMQQATFNYNHPLFENKRKRWDGFYHHIEWILGVTPAALGEFGYTFWVYPADHKLSNALHVNAALSIIGEKYSDAFLQEQILRQFLVNFSSMQQLIPAADALLGKMREEGLSKENFATLHHDFNQAEQKILTLFGEFNEIFVQYSTLVNRDAQNKDQAIQNFVQGTVYQPPTNCREFYAGFMFQYWSRYFYDTKRALFTQVFDELTKLQAFSSVFNYRSHYSQSSYRRSPHFGCTHGFISRSGITYVERVLKLLPAGLHAAQTNSTIQADEREQAFKQHLVPQFVNAHHRALLHPFQVSKYVVFSPQPSANTPELFRLARELDFAYFSLLRSLELMFKKDFPANDSHAISDFYKQTDQLWFSKHIIDWLKTHDCSQDNQKFSLHDVKPGSNACINNYIYYRLLALNKTVKVVKNFFLAHIQELAQHDIKSGRLSLDQEVDFLQQLHQYVGHDTIAEQYTERLMQSLNVTASSPKSEIRYENLRWLLPEFAIKEAYFTQDATKNRWLFALAQGPIAVASNQPEYYFVKELVFLQAQQLLEYSGQSQKLWPLAEFVVEATQLNQVVAFAERQNASLNLSVPNEENKTVLHVAGEHMQWQLLNLLSLREDLDLLRPGDIVYQPTSSAAKYQDCVLMSALAQYANASLLTTALAKTIDYLQQILLKKVEAEYPDTSYAWHYLSSSKRPAWLKSAIHQKQTVLHLAAWHLDEAVIALFTRSRYADVYFNARNLLDETPFQTFMHSATNLPWRAQLRVSSESLVRMIRLFMQVIPESQVLSTLQNICSKQQLEALHWLRPYFGVRQIPDHFSAYQTDFVNRTVLPVPEYFVLAEIQLLLNNHWLFVNRPGVKGYTLHTFIRVLNSNYARWFAENSQLLERWHTLAASNTTAIISTREFMTRPPLSSAATRNSPASVLMYLAAALSKCTFLIHLAWLTIEESPASTPSETAATENTYPLEPGVTLDIGWDQTTLFVKYHRQKFCELTNNSQALTVEGYRNTACQVHLELQGKSLSFAPRTYAVYGVEHEHLRSAGNCTLQDFNTTLTHASQQLPTYTEMLQAEALLTELQALGEISLEISVTTGIILLVRDMMLNQGYSTQAAEWGAWSVCQAFAAARVGRSIYAGTEYITAIVPAVASAGVQQLLAKTGLFSARSMTLLGHGASVAASCYFGGMGFFQATSRTFASLFVGKLIAMGENAFANRYLLQGLALKLQRLQESCKELLEQMPTWQQHPGFDTIQQFIRSATKKPQMADYAIAQKMCESLEKLLARKQEHTAQSYDFGAT